MKGRSLRTRWMLVGLVTSALAAVGSGALAGDVDQRATTLIVPWSAGGPVDAGARIVASYMQQRLGAPVVVDNRTGASGAIGAQIASQAKADGFTVFVGNVDTQALNPVLRKQLPYDPLRGFEPVGYLGELPLVMATRAQLGVRSGQDLVKLARANPGKLTYGSWGVGSLGHLAGAMVEQIGAIEMLHVPYQGGAPAQQALLGGQIDLLVTQVPYAADMQRNGRLKILGLTGARRSRLFPTIPTLDEQGFKGFAAEQWVAFFVPAGTPEPARARLTEAINAVVATPEVAKKLQEVGFEPGAMNPSDIAAMVRANLGRWDRLVKERSIRLE